ncbi:MAG: hypothetical protein HKN60_04630 [Rhizobiales bacterium]|nr:hypothetical protein [Hyphomicrobiales bacterium]
MTRRSADTRTCDAAIVGAGPAGLCAATLLARTGASVALIGPVDANAADTRTSALFAASLTILQQCGVWPQLQPLSAALQKIRIVDRITRSDYPSIVLFDAQEIGDQPFGYNVANTDLVRAFEQRFGDFEDVLRIASPVTSIDHHSDGVQLGCEDGTSILARLVVAADGQNSPARSAAGINAARWDYGQTAIATRISHELDHAFISTEVHRKGGPLATVPLPGLRSAIVWLERPEVADELKALDDAAFAGRLEAEIGDFLGSIELAGTRGTFPVRGLSTTTLARSRTVLVGEAGHVLPPIGAQGLNLGIRDAAWLADIVAGALDEKSDPGGEQVLAQYRWARRSDTMTRRAASDLLNRSLLFDSLAMRSLRDLGLTGLASIGPLRRNLMRHGVGGDHSLPSQASSQPG